MKKFFSLIALVGVFAACQPEDLTTAFTVGPAELTITATAKSAAPGFSEGAVTYTPGKSVVKTGSPVLAAGTENFTATFEGAKGEATASWPQLLAGATADINVDIFIPYNSGEYVISVEKAGETTAYGAFVEDVFTPGKYWMLPAAAHGHGVANQTVTLAGKDYTVAMLENANEFILNDSYTFTSYEGSFVPEEPEVKNADFEADVLSIAESYDGEITSKDKTVDFQVSAWAIYNVLSVVEQATTTYNVVATPKGGVTDAPNLPNNGVVGTFKVNNYNSIAQFFEAAHPDHAGHYVAEHGHGHGDGNNAGGGLVIAE